MSFRDRALSRSRRCTGNSQQKEKKSPSIRLRLDKKQLIGQIFQNAGVSKAMVQQLITCLAEGRPYFETLQQMTEQTTPKMMRLIKQTLASQQMKDYLRDSRKQKGLSEDAYLERIQQLFKKPELEDVSLQKLFQALLKQKGYNQIFEEIKQEILPRQARLIQSIIKSNELKKIINEIHPEESVQARVEKNLRAIFKRSGVEKVNLQHLITAMIKGKPYMQMVQQMSQQTSPKNIRLIRQTLSSPQLRQTLLWLRKKNCTTQQNQHTNSTSTKFIQSQQDDSQDKTIQLQIQNCQEYLKQLTQDIQQIPSTLIEYKLRKLEIQYNQYFVQNHKELGVTEEVRVIVEGMPKMGNLEAEKARKNIKQNKDIRRNLKIIRLLTCGMDMHDVFRMIQKGREIQDDCFQKLRQDDRKIKVILFLGLSKSGKTTLLTRLMGYQMQKTKISGLFTIQPKNPKSLHIDHKDLIIGYSNRSTTRYPRLFEIPQKFLKRRHDDDDQMEYQDQDQDFVTYGMDCPGFEDTAGIQVEISNRITTIEALKKVDKLQIVILINQKNWGSHGEDITKLAKTVSSIIKNYRLVRDAITFVFNQCDQDFISTLHAQVVDLFQNIKMKGSSVLDQNFKQFFKQLKQQTKDPDTILVVNPLTLDPYWFLKMVSFRRDYIENPANCLIGDIGFRQKEQIRKYCQHCICQFKQNFSDGNLEGANYYLRMLERVGNQEKLESSAQFQVLNMKNNIKQRLEYKITKLNVEFEQLQIVIIKDKAIRSQKLDTLQNLYTSLLMEIQQYYQICNQVQCTLQSELQNVLMQTFRFYIQKMNDWKDCHSQNVPQLMDYTKMAVDIFQRFADNPMKQQFNDSIQNLIQLFTTKITGDFNSLSQKNQVNKNYKLYSSLKQSIGKNKTRSKFSLEEQIQQKFKQYKEAVNLINFQKLDDGVTNRDNRDFNWINQAYDEEFGIRSIENLLKFIKIVKKYPAEVTKKIKEEIRKLSEYIVVKVPKEVMQEFQQVIKISFEEQDEIALSLADSISFANMHKYKEEKDKIKKIQKLIRWLHLLNKISSIREYYGDKLIQCFNGLEHLIENQMRKFDVVKQAFNQNDVDKFKKHIKKMRSQFKQLEKLVKATEKTQIINRFQQLQEDLTDSIINFVKTNDVSENLMLNTTAELEKVLFRCKKLREFKSIYKLLTSTSELKQEIEFLIKKIGKSIMEPLQVHLKQMKTKNRFQASKLSQYLQYVAILHREDTNSCLEPELRLEILEVQKQTRQQAFKLYVELIQSPLNNLKNTLQANISLEDNQIDEILSNLKTSFIDKCRRALRMAFQLQQKQNVKNFLFTDIEITFKQFNQTLQTLQLIIKQKIEFKQISINTLDKLRKIVINLKSVQVLTNDSKQKVFDELNTIIRQKIKYFQQGYQKSREQLFREGNDPDMFEEERFRNAYKKSLDDVTEVGKKNKIQLDQFFGEYRRKVQKKLSEANVQSIDEQQVDVKAVQFLKTINKYLSNSQIIQQKLPQFQVQTKIKDISILLQQLDIKIMQHFNRIKKQIMFTKGSELHKKSIILKQIQNQVKKLKEHGLELPQFQKYKIENNVCHLNQEIGKEVEVRIKKIKSLKSCNNFANVDGSFNKFYQSLEKNDKEEIVLAFEKEAEEKIGVLKRLYDQNYQKFIVEKEEFEKVLAKMPKQMNKLIKGKIDKNLLKIQEEYDSEIKKIVGDQGNQLDSVINLAKKLKTIGNLQKIKTLDNHFKQVSNRIINQISGQQMVPFLNKNIWQDEQYYENVPQQILSTISKIESKLMQKIQKTMRQKWQKFFTKYNQFRSGFDDALSEFAKSQSPSLLKRITQDKLLHIIDVYCTIFRAKEEGRILSKEAVFKAEDITGETEENFRTYIQDGRECVEQFQLIVKDTASYENNIQETFQALRLYEKDFQTLNMARKNQLEFQLKSQLPEVSALFVRIRNAKEQLYAKVNLIMLKKFVFFSDETKNNSEDQEEQRVEIYENNLKTLQILCSPYNNFMMPPKEITIQKTKLSIQLQTKKAVQQFEKAFNQFVYRESQVMDNKIVSIPKLFKKISSKPRQFFLYCSQYEDHFTKIYRDSLKNQQNQLDGLINQIINIQENKYREFEQLKKVQQEKLEKFMESNRSDKLRSIRDTEKSLKSKMEIQTDEKQKSKLKIQLDSKLKQIQATTTKAKTHQQSKYQSKLQKFIQNHKKDSQERIQTFLVKLLKLKRLSAIQEISTEVNNRIDDKLKKLGKLNKVLQQIHDNLLASDSYIASLILDQHAIFKKFKGLKFAEETKETNSALVILGEMFKKRSITNDQKQAFLNYYNKLDREQSRYIKSYTEHRDKSIINSLVLSIKADGQQFQKIHELGSGQIKEDRRISMLAKIFALWSIGSSESEDSQQQQITICNKAHAAQIICILIILCMDNAMTSQIIKCNRLAQVKTGQGKSIVLAVLSIYFALFGYEVHCACYSNMLSKRDEKQFQKLFELCGVQSKIHYGIFQDIIKRVLNQKDQRSHKQETFQNVSKSILLDDSKDVIQKHADFIDKFKSFFGGFNKNSKSTKNKSKKVLIIDQIDVLFNKNYYGDTFNQSIDLKDSTILQLFWYIWKNKENIRPETIQNSQQFKAVIKKFKPLTQILKNQLNGMVAALSTYKDQNYLVIDKKIMYKVEDSIMDVSYSYNTIYAYLEEYEKNKISEAAFQDHMTINLCVAEFSYACLPEYYSNVVGVTGTLTCLPNYIKTHLQKKYKIEQKQMFPIPSVYGNKIENRKIFDPIICERQNHNAEIVTNIQQQFSKNRPILIFFRNKSELLQFYNSQTFTEYQKYTSYITEQHSEFQRNQRIKISSYKETITLLTNSFIRGTDFKLLNKKAIEFGGFHAIVTYLIDTTADYIQATGRVARQGKEGSFVEIYVDDDLQLLGINKNSPGVLKKIPLERSKKQEKEKISCEEKLGVSQKRHDETIKIFLDDKFDQEKLIHYVFSKNKFPVIDTNARKARMVMIVDATGSMNTFFTQLKLFLPQIFDDVYQTLQLKKVNGCLQMQIVLYRNYNSPVSQLLQFSTFQSQAQNLKKFIKQAKTSGGWGNEAIEVALQHVNNQKNINQIILIGDDRGNTIAQVKHKRSAYPQWEEERIAHGFVQTSTEKEAEELVRKSVKVSGFYLKGLNDVKLYFQKLCKQTKGVSKNIDIYEKNSTAVMTQFIVERALKLIGGESTQGLNGDALVAQYKLLLSKRLGR